MAAQHHDHLWRDHAVNPAPASARALWELLTTPTEEDVDSARQAEGDLVVVGAGGKMGPSLAVLAQKAFTASGNGHRVWCVSRFTDASALATLNSAGITCVACDVLDRQAVARLPDAAHVLYLVGMKFGATGQEPLTWAENCLAPAYVAERYRSARIVALSTGNVYPLVAPETGGATEDTPPCPIGEYAQSCLGRERVLRYMAARHGTPLLLVRLNYATDLRYGVLVDIAQAVHDGRPVVLRMGWFNTVWQGYANSVLLRAFRLCAVEGPVLNLTGAEMGSVRASAESLAAAMRLPPPRFVGCERRRALLSNASRCHALFGRPQVGLDTLLDWTASWVSRGGPILGRPTHFSTRDGRF